MQLEPLIQGWMQQFAVPGLALALIENAEVAWFHACGLKHQTRAEPVQIETVFEAASLTKPVVAQALMQHVQVGALGLDATLESYLGRTPGLEGVTVRHLLSHTSGLPNWLPEGEAARTRFQPGSRFSYSGVGYRQLQHMLEQVTGQPLQVILERSVFVPLGMRDSSVVWRSDFDARCATGHDADGQPTQKSQPDEAHAAFSLHSTVGDLARFVIATMQDGAVMLEPQMAVNDDLAPWHPDWPRASVSSSDQVFWGLGWGLEWTGSNWFFWQWGDNGAFKALVIASKETRQGLVALSNSANADRLWRPLATEALGGAHPALDWLEALNR